MSEAVTLTGGEGASVSAEAVPLTRGEGALVSDEVVTLTGGKGAFATEEAVTIIGGEDAFVSGEAVTLTGDDCAFMAANGHILSGGLEVYQGRGRGFGSVSLFQTLVGWMLIPEGAEAAETGGWMASVSGGVVVCGGFDASV